MNAKPKPKQSTSTTHISTNTLGNGSLKSSSTISSSTSKSSSNSTINLSKSNSGTPRQLKSRSNSSNKYDAVKTDSFKIDKVKSDSSISKSSRLKSSTSAASSKTVVVATPILAKWDKGSKTVRQQILIEFLTTHKKKGKLTLVEEFGSGASLFLARLTASLTIAYKEGLSMSQLLRGIGIFVGSGEDAFLVDFVKSGSLSTILDLLVLADVSEDDKQDSLDLLAHIVAAGRQYKQLICDNRGISNIVSCMQKCTLPHTVSLCAAVLRTLGTDNPTYSQTLQQSLATLLPSHSPTSTIVTDISLLACHAAAQILRFLLSPPNSIAPSQELVNPILSMLAVPNLAIHSEAAALIDILMKQQSMREEVVKELVDMTMDVRGGQMMKQHHHVYINNVSLVRNGNINTTASASYAGFALRSEDSMARVGSRILSVVPSALNSSPPNVSPKAAGNEKSTSITDPNEGSPPSSNFAKISASKRTSNSDLLSQIHQNSFNARIIDSQRKSPSELLSETPRTASQRRALMMMDSHQRKSTSDLLSDFQTLARTTSHRRTISIDSADDTSHSHFNPTGVAPFAIHHEANGRRASASDLFTTLPTGVMSANNSVHHSVLPIVPPLELYSTEPAMASPPSYTSSSSSPRSLPSSGRFALTLSPITITSSPSSPTTPTSPSSLQSPGSTSSLSSPQVITTTTHLATAMVMQRLAEEWGTLLIRHGAISAILFSILNTTHVPTHQQLFCTLSFLCILHTDGMNCLVELVGDLAYPLSRGYEHGAVMKLRDEIRRRETNAQQPIANDLADTLTIRMWE